MQSISVLPFCSPVFSELQEPMQDRYGIHRGWIQHLRVCILQPRAPANFVTKADRCLHPRNNAARVGTRRLSSRSFDCAPTAGRGRQDFACGLRRPQYGSSCQRTNYKPLTPGGSAGVIENLTRAKFSTTLFILLYSYL